MTFKCPARDPNFASHSIHGVAGQENFLKRVLAYCKNFRVAVDVGAHVGICTEYLTTRFERVWAFEPTQENFECLKANVGDRAILQNVALGSTEGNCSMHLPGAGNSGMWHATVGQGVELEKLDNYMLSNVDFIKIDTEGFEGNVVLGAQETIEASKPLIVFEDNGLGSKYYGDEWLDPKSILSAMGYGQLARLNKDEIWMHL